jgi:hypothetical protein
MAESQKSIGGYRSGSRLTPCPLSANVIKLRVWLTRILSYTLFRISLEFYISLLVSRVILRPDTGAVQCT